MIQEKKTEHGASYITAQYIAARLLENSEYHVETRPPLTKQSNEFQVILHTIWSCLNGNHSLPLNQLMELTEMTEETLNDCLKQSPSLFYSPDAICQKADTESAPIIYYEGALYLKRYWMVLCQLLSRLEQSLTHYKAKKTDKEHQTTIAHFSTEQQIIADSLRRKGLAIVSGSAGSGKSWTALELVKIYREDTSQKIALCAPTGKVATRLRSGIDDPKIEIKTIHSLIAKKIDGPAKHHANYLLPYTLVVVDEVSMIDWELFLELLQALNVRCRVVLMGDPMQLNPEGISGLLSFLCEKFSDHHTHLTSQYRYQNQDIAQLADLAKQGSLLTTDLPEPHSLKCKPSQQKKFLSHWIKQFLHPIYQTKNSADYERLSSHVILSPWRHSYKGVHQLNQDIQNMLYQNGDLSKPNDLCSGLPIVIRKNHSRLNLFNGDLGYLLEKNGELLAILGENTLQMHELPSFDVSYVMTVHQTQGSEFDHVLLWLGEIQEKDKLWLSTNLLYTSITRAKKSILICGNTGNADNHPKMSLTT